MQFLLNFNLKSFLKFTFFKQKLTVSLTFLLRKFYSLLINISEIKLTFSGCSSHKRTYC